VSETRKYSLGIWDWASGITSLTLLTVTNKSTLKMEYFGVGAIPGPVFLPVSVIATVVGCFHSSRSTTGGVMPALAKSSDSQFPFRAA